MSIDVVITDIGLTGAAYFRSTPMGATLSDAKGREQTSQKTFSQIVKFAEELIA
jgi:hypothetical protein